jgi:hypothetical protein
MKPSEILKKARDLIINKGWTQGEYARDGGKVPVSYDSKWAESFCALGSLYSVIDEAQGGIGTIHFLAPFQPLCSPHSSIHYLQTVIGHDFTIVHWNDMPGRTKEQVIDAFDEAIELAESEGS